MINQLNPEDYTEDQNVIIRQLCQIQLESFKRIEENNDLSGEDVTMLLIHEDVSRETFIDTLLTRVEKIEELHQYPENLKVLDIEDISAFRHLLTNLEDMYNKDYPQAISNLWNRLFLIEQTQEMANYKMFLNN